MDKSTHRSVALEACRFARNYDRKLTEAASVEIADAVPDTDDFADLEFVNVEAGAADALSSGRDNPHADDVGALHAEDHTSTKPSGYSITCFNHFIDIRKGIGIFDDFDGYSYQRGSAHVEEFQTLGDYLAHDAPNEVYGLSGFVGQILEKVKGMPGIGSDAKVDAALNYWFNDEYVHAPGHPWYKGCSPAVEHYTYLGEGLYANLRSESVARFPLAEWRGHENHGIPYSVFMPEDNLARYWYEQFVARKAWPSLGPVLHAVMDQSIPHHAAGTCGNWHSRYEHTLGQKAEQWRGTSDDKIRQLLANWGGMDPNPPTRLSLADVSRQPASNWRIDMLVTWMALQAYQAYTKVYSGFRNGYHFDDSSAHNLFVLAAAMSAHVVRTAMYQAFGHPTHEHGHPHLHEIADHHHHPHLHPHPRGVNHHHPIEPVFHRG